MKKLALYFVSFCSFFFVGCSDNSVTPTHTVMFNVDGGSAVAEQTIEENKKATKPADPTKDLYTFVGWYADEALTTSFDFETPITANTTLYAKWTEKTFTVTYKSDASTEVGTQKVPVATPTLTKNTSLVAGKYIIGFFTDEAKSTAFDFSKNITADVTIYVTPKDFVTPADSTALVIEIDKAITEQGDSPDLNYINTEKVKTMKELFQGKTDFNGDVSEWNVSAVNNMVSMFAAASNFNSDLSKWDVRAVNNMANMFNAATAFNRDINKWNVSAVKNMRLMFRDAGSFNGDISEWNVGAVTDMVQMFQGATAFNADISKWDVSAVTDMGGMFSGASAFNQDISSWEASSLLNAFSMFKNATAFDQDLDAWAAHLPLDDNGKFTVSEQPFFKDDMFTGTLREDNPPSWY